MNGTEIAIGLAAGVAGFGVVWWIFNIVRQQKSPPVEMHQVTTRSGARRLSVAELGSTWHVILGVSSEATSAEIEAGYHARLVECDRVRFSPSETTLARENAEATRAQVNEAFEFIRPVRR
jgi:hypothetical protein